jgi:hypothetical protein
MLLSIEAGTIVVYAQDSCAVGILQVDRNATRTPVPYGVDDGFPSNMKKCICNAQRQEARRAMSKQLNGDIAAENHL